MTGLRLPLIAGLAAGCFLVAAVILIRWQAISSVRIETERKDYAAGETSDRARSAFDVCVDSGRLWDYSARKCVGTAPGGRY